MMPHGAKVGDVWCQRGSCGWSTLNVDHDNHGGVVGFMA